MSAPNRPEESRGFLEGKPCGGDGNHVRFNPPCLRRSKNDLPVRLGTSGGSSLFLLAGKTISLKRLMLLWLLLGAGFLSILLLIGIPWLGLDSFLRVLKSHFLVFEHTGYYGTGSEGFVDINSFIQNARNLWLAATPFLYLSAAVLPGSIMAALFDFRHCFQHCAL